MNKSLCVQCGELVDSLFIQYSDSHFRLSRCSQCGHVADKYIEYELLLVLIDILLHRRPAFRHLMFNRYDKAVTSRFEMLLPLGIIVLGIASKTFILSDHISINQSMNVRYLINALCATILEYIAFIVPISLCIPVIRNSSLRTDYSKLFLSLLFPESFKVIGVVMHMFDSEPNIHALLGILILSIQYMSLQSITDIPHYYLSASMIFAVALRLGSKLLWYNRNDLWLLGGFA